MISHPTAPRASTIKQGALRVARRILKNPDARVGAAPADGAGFRRKRSHTMITPKRAQHKGSQTISRRRYPTVNGRRLGAGHALRTNFRNAARWFGPGQEMRLRCRSIWSAYAWVGGACRFHSNSIAGCRSFHPTYQHSAPTRRIDACHGQRCAPLYAIQLPNRDGERCRSRRVEPGYQDWQGRSSRSAANTELNTRVGHWKRRSFHVLRGAPARRGPWSLRYHARHFADESVTRVRCHPNGVVQRPVVRLRELRVRAL